MSQSLSSFISSSSTLSKPSISFLTGTFRLPARVKPFGLRSPAQFPQLFIAKASSTSSDPEVASAAASPQVLVSSNGLGSAIVSDTSSIDVDAVTEAELKENGFRSTRRTKLICTIGPATCGSEELEALAGGGMNVARINMCHSTREWHRRVIERVRKLNEEKGYAVAIMMDTEGSEIRMGDLGGASSVKAEVN